MTSKCQHEGNTLNAKFCRHCGLDLTSPPPPSPTPPGTLPTTTTTIPSAAPRVCVSCGTVAKKAQAKFCALCGAKMDGAPPLPPTTSTSTAKPSDLPPRRLTATAIEVADTIPPSEAPPPNPVTSPKSPPITHDTLSPQIQSSESSSDMTFTAPTKISEGFTPMMLQSENISELQGWRSGAVLGKGSFGTVYLGMLRSGTIVAVKQIHIINGTNEIETLAREVMTMRVLQHKNISRFLGCEYKDSAINIFMEYVSGGSLADLIKKFKPLPRDVLSSYTRQILTALEYLHRNHIIHRDIKADNILVETSTTVPRDAVIKLVDFGTSRHLEGTVQKCRTFVGTPYWMAPEVLTSPEGYTFHADIWSVGCTVVEMITGKAPWPMKENIHQAVYMIGCGTVPMEIPTDVDPECKDFLDQCFQRDPEHRPSAATLLQHPFLK